MIENIHWKYLVIALVASLGLWYMINAKEQVERVIEVRLDYKGLPPGLVITSGQLNKISVRIRGPLELLRSTSNRELSYTMDLSSVTKGTNIVPLGGSQLPDLRVYQILEVIPSRMILEVDEILETTLPVQTTLRDSPVTPSLSLTQLKVMPKEVMVRGPARIISRIKSVSVEIPPDLNDENKLISSDLPVLVPAGIETFPPLVSVERLIEVRRSNLTLQRDILPDKDMPDGSLNHNRASLVVSVPRSLVRDSGYLNQFQVSVTMPFALVNNEYKLPLQVSKPLGGELIRINPETVILTKNKK